MAVRVQGADAGLGELLTPKLVTVLREGYGLQSLRADALAGLTVAIVALPLSLAIAIASGVEPERGLYAAIIGGFLVSALGGSRFQIGGPAGAFIVLVATTVAEHGVEGVLLATLLSGPMLILMGVLRIGSFIKYIPYPVTLGFTAGIAVVILASQLKELLGLTLAVPEPGPLLPKLQVLALALPSISPAAVGTALLTILIILGVRRWRPRWPALLLAIFAASVIAWALGLPVETIGTRYGGIPATLPLPSLPEITLAKVTAVLPNALAFTLLGSIESLLSAVVADSMTGRRHRSSCELVAQGVANIASALFGGICVTGTIARTATNVRAGARGPVSGMLHSAFLLLIMLLAAPLAAYIPLPALAGLLATVAWNMAERHGIAMLVRASRADALVLLVTFLLVAFDDLSTGIVVGFALAALLALHRMARTVEVVGERPPLVPEDMADPEGRPPYDPTPESGQDVLVLRISGAFFFGAAASVSGALDRIAAHPRAYVIDVSGVPFLDSTAATTIQGFARKARAAGATVQITGARAELRRMLLAHGLRPPEIRFAASVADALARLGKAERNGMEAAPVSQ